VPALVAGFFMRGRIWGMSRGLLEGVLIFALTLLTSVFTFVIIFRWFNISRSSRPSTTELESVVTKYEKPVLNNAVLLVIVLLIAAIIALTMYAG